MQFSRKNYQDTLLEEIQNSEKKFWLITGHAWVWKKTFLHLFHERLLHEKLPSVLVELQESDTIDSALSQKKDDIRDAYVHIISPYFDILDALVSWYEEHVSEIRGLCTTGRVYFGQYKEVTEFPLSGISWREYRDELFPSWKEAWDEGSENEDMKALEKAHETYLLSGAFPSVLTEENPETRRIRQQEIFEKKCTEVVQQLYKKDEILFRKFLTVLATETGSLLKWDYFSRLATIPRRKVRLFLDVLEEYGMIERLSPFVRDEKLETGLHDRFYWSDLSYICVLLWDLYLQWAMRIRVLENFLYLELKSLLSPENTLWFYRKKSQATIPFLIYDSLWDTILPITILERDTIAVPQVFRSFHDLYGPSVKRYMVFTHSLNDTRKIWDTEIIYRKCTDM